MARYDIGIHGSSIEVHRPERVRSFQRYSHGTGIRQESDDNWFFFALPSPTVLKNNEDVVLTHINLKATARNARIVSFHVYAGEEDIMNWSVDLSDRIDHNIAHPLSSSAITQVNEPIGLSIKVEFRSDGFFEFHGATGAFVSR